MYTNIESKKSSNNIELYVLDIVYMYIVYITYNASNMSHIPFEAMYLCIFVPKSG